MISQIQLAAMSANELHLATLLMAKSAWLKSTMSILRFHSHRCGKKSGMKATLSLSMFGNPRLLMTILKKIQPSPYYFWHH